MNEIWKMRFCDRVRRPDSNALSFTSFCHVCLIFTDWCVFKNWKRTTIEHTQEDVQVIADKGYVAEQYVITPRKKPRGRELTNAGKDFNRTISSARAAIENINQRVKQYAILGHTYRGSFDDVHKITKIAHVVCALCNLNLDKHPIRGYRS
jgi:thiamine kinase-like enzyme